MRPGNDNQIDWTAAATPQGHPVGHRASQSMGQRTGERTGERMLPSLNRPEKSRVVPQTRRSVMDTLLGENDLSAIDVNGSDPYNATGRQFRR